VIPGKKYKPEDFIESAWRRRWFILIPLVVIALGTMIVVERLPDRYESSATLLIVPQRIPESYVKNPVSVRIDERLMSIGQEILSRTRLESIVQEFNLYPEERRTKIMEDVIETMRTRDILFNTRNARADSGSFTISFQYSDPRTAQQVAQRLASLFIQENTQDRAVLAELTDEFLNSQLKDAERQLKERENQLAQFRRDHPGTMPTQVDSNQQGLQNAQLQLQGVQESISRDRDRQITIQRQIADIQMQASLAPPPDANGQAQPQSYARQLEQARAALKNMRL
jgi:uncharacterized protein involved in exopolysaccharide biosynthesis